jgi:ribosomal protein L16 Arg81 hydroxylase
LKKISSLKKIDSLNNATDCIYVYDYPLIRKYQDSFKIDDIKEIFKAINTLSIERPNIRGDFYRDGKNLTQTVSSELMEELEKDISKLNDVSLSVRVSNFQLIDKDIRVITNKLSQELKESVTCNMYITPSSEENCFKYHIDEQQSIIAQLYGSKRWFFPMVAANNFMKRLEIQDVNNINDDIKEEFIVNTGDSFVIGQNIVHKAHLEGSTMSVHLTFAVLKQNAFNITKYIIETLKESFIEDGHQYQSIKTASDIENLKSNLVKKIQNIDSEKEIITINKAQMVNDISILKKGRHY